MEQTRFCKVYRFIWAVLFLVWCMVPINLSIGAPVPGGPGFLSIGSYELKPINPLTSYKFIDGRLVNDNDTIYAVFLAPIHIPHGATITQFTLYFIDNGSANIIIYLKGTPLDNTSVENEIFLVENLKTSGALPDPRTLIVNTFSKGSIVDNQSNFYTIEINMPPGDEYRIGGVRIDYAFPVNLPIILK